MPWQKEAFPKKWFERPVDALGPRRPVVLGTAWHSGNSDLGHLPICFSGPQFHVVKGLFSPSVLRATAIVTCACSPGGVHEFTKSETARATSTTTPGNSCSKDFYCVGMIQMLFRDRFIQSPL